MCGGAERVQGAVRAARAGRLTRRACRRLTHERRQTIDPNGAGDAPSDAELIARWQEGDDGAATRLVERHAPALARFVSAQDSRADVQEVVQDTFVRAFSSLEGFRAESAFRTWLFTIARRLLMDRRRATRRRGELVEVSEDDARTDFGALDEMVAEETRGRLWRLVERLTPTQREVFVLRAGEGMSYREIAEAVGTTEGAARVHYHNALRAVKESIDA